MRSGSNQSRNFKPALWTALAIGSRSPVGCVVVLTRQSPTYFHQFGPQLEYSSSSCGAPYQPASTQYVSNGILLSTQYCRMSAIICGVLFPPPDATARIGGMICPFESRGNLVLEHEPMDQRLEFSPRLVLADQHEDGRLADRFSGQEPEVGPLHADLDVHRLARIRKPRLPRSRPADGEQIAVLVVEIQFEERNEVVRRPPAGRRQDLLFSGFNRERFRDEVRRLAGRTAQDIEHDGLGRFRLVYGKLQRPEVGDNSRRFRLREVGQQDGVFLRGEALVVLAVEPNLKSSIRGGHRSRLGGIARRLDLRTCHSRFRIRAVRLRRFPVVVKGWPAGVQPTGLCQGHGRKDLRRQQDEQQQSIADDRERALRTP